MITKEELQSQLDQSTAQLRDLKETVAKCEGMIYLCNFWLAKIANKEIAASLSESPPVPADTVQPV